MKTANQFAEEISAITADLEPGTDLVPVEDASLEEEIADWRGPLQEIQVRLRRMIQQDIDKFLESANKILTDAEKSEWSKLAIQNSVARWSKDVNKVYADFKNSTNGFLSLVKAMGITTRRHSTKGKAPGQRGKMDWGKLSQVQLKKEVRAQIKRLSAGIHSLADDGSFMLHQIDRILKYKQPKDETVREEIGALHQDFVDFRNAFGSKVWGPYNGLIGRLNSVRDQPIPKRSSAYRSSMRKKPMKSMPQTPQFTQVAHSALPVDCPELREAIERDSIRATNAVMGENQDDSAALIESIEEELLGEAEADKMKAKGYKFKILLKNKPPLYAKTEKGAKDVQKDYPGSKIVKNESEEIDDEACLEAIDNDLFDCFEDFDAMLYPEEEELVEGDSEPPFPQTEAVEFDKGKRIADGPARQKQVIQQIFGHMRLKGGQIEPGPGSKFMHGIVDIPGGRLEFDADRERVAWTAYANGSVIDKGYSEYGGSINKLTKPIKAAANKVAKTEDQGFGIEPDGELDENELTEAALKNRKKLYDDLKDIDAKGIAKLGHVPRSYKDLKNEVYGRQAMIYVSWKSREDREEGEYQLSARGYRVQKGYWKGSAVSEIQVSYFKGAHWDEDVDKLDEMSQVANTIFQQFGGGRAMAMIGGKAMVSGSNTLSIKWPNKKRSKGNVVEITYLPGKDLYDMEFFNSSMKAHKSVKKFKGIYADQLVPIFEKQTGWYLHL